MKDFADLQSRLSRIREQRRHLRKRQKELFDRGMSDLSKEIRGGGEPGGEATTSEPSASDPVVSDELAEVGFDQWARENGLEMPEFGAAVVAGQGSGDANPQSLS